MNPVKPGYLTTEFWVTVATQAIAVVSLFSPDLGANVLGKWVQPFAIVAAALATLVYTHTRGKLKTAAASPLGFAPVPDTGELFHANLSDEPGDLVDRFPEPAGYDKVPAASAAVKAAAKRRR